MNRTRLLALFILLGTAACGSKVEESGNAQGVAAPAAPAAAQVTTASISAAPEFDGHYAFANAGAMEAAIPEHARTAMRVNGIVYDPAARIFVLEQCQNGASCAYYPQLLIERRPGSFDLLALEREMPDRDPNIASMAGSDTLTILRARDGVGSSIRTTGYSPQTGSSKITPKGVYGDLVLFELGFGMGNRGILISGSDLLAIDETGWLAPKIPLTFSETSIEELSEEQGPAPQLWSFTDNTLTVRYPGGEKVEFARAGGMLRKISGEIPSQLTR